MNPRKFRQSAFAHKHLDGLKGIEIGGSAHNDFGLDTVNVDWTDSMDTIFKDEEFRICGERMPVDIVAEADRLTMIPDSSYDFLLNSHVIEHIPDTIGCIEEWHRVVKPGGLILFVVPIRDLGHAVDKIAPYVTTAELFEDYRTKQTVATKPVPEGHGERGHFHQWNYNLFQLMLANFFSTRLKEVDSLEVDDKVGNGSMHLYRVIK